MGLNAKKAPGTGGGGSKQDPVANGPYPSRVVQIIDLGLQPQRPFDNKPKPPAHELMMTYELVDEFCKDEEGNEDPTKPRWISEDFVLHNLKAERAKSTIRYKVLDPNDEHDGDFAELVDTPTTCIVTQRAVKSGANAGKVYNNVGSIAEMRPKDAENCPPLVNPSKVFLLDEPDLEVFFSLPDWLQEKITKNLEFEGSLFAKVLENHVEQGAEDPKPEVEEEPSGQPEVEQTQEDTTSGDSAQPETSEESEEESDKQVDW